MGLASVKAYQKDKEAAWAKIKEAEGLIKTENDKADVYEGKIHLVYLLFTPEMLPTAEEAFKQTMDIKPGHALACFYMALIYEKAFLFDKALSLLNRVLKTENPFVLRAYNEIDKITKIKKAQPITNIGKEIGLKNVITKADMAALLVHELHLSQLIEVSPNNLLTGKDILGEHFAKEIIAIIPLEIRELSATVDAYFDPEQKITKASLCEILEDILVRLTGNKDLRHRFKQVRSPYKDLDTKAPCYNACILGLVKGFILPQDRLNKLFGTLSAVSGADALLALKRLREEARIF
jgi:tetratricopeptide (TPR) repeat protein